MDEELQYEQNLILLGSLRDRLYRLEETDYPAAMYKGYSSSGQTVAEIQTEIEEANQQIEDLNDQLETFDWK